MGLSRQPSTDFAPLYCDEGKHPVLVVKATLNTRAGRLPWFVHAIINWALEMNMAGEERRAAAGYRDPLDDKKSFGMPL